MKSCGDTAREPKVSRAGASLCKLDKRPSAAATFGRRARTARDHPRAPVPARADVAQRRPAAHGQAEGPAGAGGVLGLLPRQLAAHPALPEGLARALRGRGPARDRRPHRRVPALARRGGDRGRGRAARDRVSGRDRHGARDLGLLRQRGLARPLPVGHHRARCSRCTTARAPTARPSCEIQELLGVEREPVAAGAPRGRAGPAAARPDRGSARRLLRPLRGGRRVGGAVGRAAS